MREIKAPEFVVKAKKAIVIEIQKGVELGMPQVEFDRLTTKMFAKWTKDDTKIAKFMKNLDPKKEYTKQEFKQAALSVGIQEIIHLTKSKVGNTNGFGTIMRKSNETYQLYPSLVESFKKHF